MDSQDDDRHEALGDDDSKVRETRQRYELERVRRLALVEQNRPAPLDALGGRLSSFGDDPFAPPISDRAPRTDQVDVLIVGAGFGGISQAIELSKVGVTDVLLVDIAGDFGGNWYWNRYPGIRCDIESYLYLPYLEETGFVPTEKYSTGLEIFDYARDLARRFGFKDRALFQTKVTELEWLEDDHRWRVTTNRGDAVDARFVITQSGLFGRPQLPNIPGLESFEGSAFHSSRWDYQVTGGYPGGELDKLGQLDVGVFGTGSTGVQIIPQLARSARSVTVFQRTPIQLAPRGNGPTPKDWFNGLEPGWQRRRVQAFDDLVMLTGKNDSEVDDGWTKYSRHQLAATESIPPKERTPERIQATFEHSDFEWNETLRSRVEEYVSDADKAAMLKAYYRTHCKRPGFSDDYLQAFDRDNVKLVDLVAEPVTQIEGDTVVTTVDRHRVDVLVFATGFDLGSSWEERAGFETIGIGGVHLSAKWKQELRTFQGLFPHGFPNLFTMGPFHVASTPNLMRFLGEQSSHIAHVIGHMTDNGLTTVETTEEAEEQWVEAVHERSELQRRVFAECTPGYLNNQGKPESAAGGLINRYAPALDYYDLIAKWRANGDFAGLTFGKD